MPLLRTRAVRRPLALAGCLVVFWMLLLPPAAGADPAGTPPARAWTGQTPAGRHPAGEARTEQDQEQQLAERFAPVVRLVHHPEECGPGEPYRPSDVDALMDNDSVALRGPWTFDDLVTVGPGAEELSRGLRDWSLDFPGDPLKPGCAYEKWANRVFAGTPSTVYAHVATQPDEPGRLALQYWFFYPFNDFNNKHEGDWERIQLEFDVGTVAEALQTEPVLAVYSAHEGSERSDWDDPKLSLANGTHPEVYVASGSHASHFTSDLFLLRSTTQGFGCDNTLGTSAITPVVRTIPSDAERAVAQYPWIGYLGRWGQRESPAFYSGATGPASKGQWTEPFTWSAGSGDRSYPVPGGSVYGAKTTDFFCDVVGQGSVLLLRFTDAPGPTLLVLAVLLGAAGWLVRRTSWKAARAWPATAERPLGQTLAVAWWVYWTRWRLFGGIGAGVAAVSLVTGAIGQFAQGLTSTVVASVALMIAILFAQAATATAFGELDAGRTATVRRSYAAATARAGALLGTAVLWTVALVLLLATLWLALLALLFFTAWSLFVMVVQLEGVSGVAALRRSWHLVRGQFVKVLLLLVLGAALSTLVGGLLGSLVLVVAQAPFVLVNLVPGVVAGLLVPFTTLAMTYAYFDGVARTARPAPPTPPAGAEAPEPAAP
ncbi:hypothetical protein E8D34_12490 [Nocardioides sp. GY 10113]|uniref:hypothetical protein n=1 Tax=Nocardioides sp. GY 10113 TaxID=2569761 RepID=UPI0010A8E0C3|nr:hypothetical protein [Nocardioides sp. GY 10113]TIC85912.1 hypothetical protein E8D34_12490 [Nocardioides sp. GY 10113]